MHMTTLRRNYNRCISGRKTRRSTTKAAFWLRMYNRAMTAAYRTLGIPITCVDTRLPRAGDLPTLLDTDPDNLADQLKASQFHWDNAFIPVWTDEDQSEYTGANCLPESAYLCPHPTNLTRVLND